MSVTIDDDVEELRGFYDYLQSENFIIENGIHKKNLSSPADAVMRLKQSNIRPRELSHINTSGSEEQTEKCRTLVAFPPSGKTTPRRACGAEGDGMGCHI